MEINIPAVETVTYVFKCRECSEAVTGTLPGIKQYGWLDVSTFGTPAQWLCPIHARGFVKAPVACLKALDR